MDVHTQGKSSYVKNSRPTYRHDHSWDRPWAFIQPAAKVFAYGENTLKRLYGVERQVDGKN